MPLFSFTTIAPSPTLGDRLDDLPLLAVGFAVLIFLLILCDALLRGLAKTFEPRVGWLNRQAATRKRKGAAFRKHYPPLRIVKSDSSRVETSLAHDALRRHADAATATPRDLVPARPRANLRVISSGEKG